MKRCGHCKESKSEECFGKDRSTKDGLKKTCKECLNAMYRDYHHRHPERAKERDKRWLQNPANRIKRCEMSKRIYWRNPEQSRVKSNALKRTEKGKARVCRYNSTRRCANSSQGNDLRADEIDLLLKHQKGRCARCQKMFSDKLPVTVDHIIPLSKGGNLTLSNVQLLCRSCNSIKNDKTILYRLLLPTEAGAGGILSWH